jgi:hypothetical protein
MDEQDKKTAIAGGGSSPQASYEAPRLTPIGNLRDILAGAGSQPCEGGLPAQASGGDAPFMAPLQCGPPE